ncbi:unnamed protein product [Jaminaea pallidilutea]
MAESTITVAVRVRPFSEKEAAQLAPQDGPLPFLGDGGLGGSPAKAPSPGPQTGAQMLRTRFLRPIIHAVDDKVLIFDPPDNNPLSRLYNNQANYMSHGQKRAKDVRYAFDRVFDGGCGQQEVFEGTTRPLLDGVLNGYNASVFAYGATGCGKTHTISGSSEDPGVIFLTMAELYRRIEDSKNESEVDIRLSYLEIYNEAIRDLLSDEPTPPGRGLLLREDQANKISVVGITEKIPESPQQVLDMIQEGNCRRTMSPTEANAVSSRSHAVLQINVTQRPKTGNVSDETTSASLNIIDLAGSERAAATSNNGARMKEGANINKSLLALGNCINALCQTAGVKGRHIPYRNSKLTRLLKFSLGGNCKTVMIVCVSPSSGHYDETSNTLKYANQAKNIRTKVSQNLVNVDRHVAQYVQTIAELRQEVASLKAQLVEGGGLDSEAERRQKREMKAEVLDVLSRITRQTAQTKEKIADASHVGILQVAEVRASVFASRLSEVEQTLTASADEDDANDLKSELGLLKQLTAANKEVLLSAREAEQRLDNTVNVVIGALGRASRNSKFDDEATEKVRCTADALKAELECARQSRRADSIGHSLEQELCRAMAWLTAACRGTVGMKDSAGELEWRAGKEEEWTDVAKHLRDIADHMRSEAARNDSLFELHIGSGTGVTKLRQTGTAKGPSSPFKRRVSGINATIHSSPSKEATRSRAASGRRLSQFNAQRPGMRAMMPMSPARKSRASLIGHNAASTAAARSSQASSKPTKRLSLAPQSHSGAVTSIERRSASTANGHHASSKPPLQKQAGSTGPTNHKEAGVRFADDTKDEPRRSITPDHPPLSKSNCEAEQVPQSSSEWLEQPAEVPTAPKLKPRASRMAMPPPARLASTAQPTTAATKGLFGESGNAIDRVKPSRRVGSNALPSIDDLLESSGTYDEEEDEAPQPKPKRAPLRSHDVLPTARQGSSTGPTSSFAAPTKASMAKSSRSPLFDDLPPMQGSHSSPFGVDENTSMISLPPPANPHGASLSSSVRHAPYKRRDSTFGPVRRTPSSLAPQLSAIDQRSSSGNHDGNELNRPTALRSRVSSFGTVPGMPAASRVSSSGGAAGSTSMFASGKISGLSHASSAGSTNATHPPSSFQRVLGSTATGRMSTGGLAAGRRRPSRDSLTGAPSDATTSNVANTSMNSNSAAGGANSSSSGNNMTTATARRVPANNATGSGNVSLANIPLSAVR